MDYLNIFLIKWKLSRWIWLESIVKIRDDMHSIFVVLALGAYCLLTPSMKYVTWVYHAPILLISIYHIGDLESKRVPPKLFNHGQHAHIKQARLTFRLIGSGGRHRRYPRSFLPHRDRASMEWWGTNRQPNGHIVQIKLKFIMISNHLSTSFVSVSMEWRKWSKVHKTNVPTVIYFVLW